MPMDHEAMWDEIVSLRDELAREKAARERAESELEAKPARKLCVWKSASFLAVAAAESVAQAREWLLIEIGESGDGSCPERDEARNAVLNWQPTIWIGPNAKFALTDSGELRESIHYSEGLSGKLKQAERERDEALTQATAMREALEPFTRAIFLAASVVNGPAVSDFERARAALQPSAGSDLLKRLRRAEEDSERLDFLERYSEIHIATTTEAGRHVKHVAGGAGTAMRGSGVGLRAALDAARGKAQ